MCPPPGSSDFQKLCPHGGGKTHGGDDINECINDPCGENGACENIIGSYRYMALHHLKLTTFLQLNIFPKISIVLKGYILIKLGAYVRKVTDWTTLVRNV